MHAAIELLIFWASAFVTLGAALALLSVFSALIENDLELHSLGKEAVIAGIASLVEAVGVWLIVLFISEKFRSLGMRGLIIPAIIVALIYKIAHLEDWSRYESLLLLMFQAFVVGLLSSLILGQFTMAIAVLIVFAVVLAIIIGFARTFWP